MRIKRLLFVLIFVFSLFALAGCTGKEGLQGEKGDQGETGPQGLQGVPGEDGQRGDRGEQGEQGAQGNPGDKGDKGDTGDKGVDGDVLVFRVNEQGVFQQKYANEDESKWRNVLDLSTILKLSVNYTVKLDVNGGTYEALDQQTEFKDLVYMTEVALPTPSFDGKMFVGWEFSGKVYNEKFAAKENAVLVAQYADYPAMIGETKYASISEAITAAAAGDVINVNAGTFNENITIDKQIKLYGPNKDVNPNTGTRVEEAVLTGKVVVNAGVSGVEICGFEFTTSATVKATSTDTVIDGFKFANNYVHNIDEVSYTWATGRNYDVPCFLKLGAQGNKLSNVFVVDNKFEHVANVNVFFAVVNTLTVSGNTFTNFKYDAVRFDGGYNYGVFTIENNTFKNDTLGGKNGLYFRSMGAEAGNYNTDKAHKIIISSNNFENIGENADFTGAISSNGYQEYGVTIEVSYNNMKNCPNFVLLRNNATAANHQAYTWVANVHHNAFIGETTGYYFKNVNPSDGAETNPALANLNDNLFIDKDNQVISDLEVIKPLIKSALELTSVLSDINQTVHAE